MDLLKFYKDNVDKDEYYYKMYDKIITFPEQQSRDAELVFGFKVNNNNKKYEIFDAEEAIEKFKYFCQPDSQLDSNFFHLLCFYLLKKGYVLNDFPRLLERPPMDPNDFIYKEIRNRAVSLGKQRENGEVSYNARRNIISKFNFSLGSNVKIVDDMKELFIKISTRNSSFEAMHKDEKIQNIANLIENLLKKDNNFVVLNYEGISFDYINDDMIKKYRRQVQCFRHATEEDINERESFSELQKEFLIEYGILLLNVIHSTINL